MGYSQMVAKLKLPWWGLHPWVFVLFGPEAPNNTSTTAIYTTKECECMCINQMFLNNQNYFSMWYLVFEIAMFTVLTSALYMFLFLLPKKDGLENRPWDPTLGIRRPSVFPSASVMMLEAIFIEVWRSCSFWLFGVGLFRWIGPAWFEPSTLSALLRIASAIPSGDKLPNKNKM